MWLTSEVAAADTAVMVATFDMLRTNPALHAVSTAQVLTTKDVVSPRVEAESGQRIGDPMTSVLGAAIRRAISAYVVEI